jgi:fatty-acyl-CoA synthase
VTTLAQTKPSPVKAWARALELTASITTRPHRTFPVVVEELAQARGDAPALLADSETLSYRELAARARRYSSWAIANGVSKGDVVCLLMANRPEYMAVWLGVTAVGGVVALLNTNVTGPSLAHSISIVSPLHVIVASEFADRLMDAIPGTARTPKLWVHGSSPRDFERIDSALEHLGHDPQGLQEHRSVSIDDRALFIYTSGTTGLPKAASVSHARLMQWTHWFAGLMNTGASDRLYNCLPMYHSVGGVLATGAALVGGGSVVVKEKFSATQFWSDVVRWDCTLFQYIGELCRYLLYTPHQPSEARHHIRMCCGNGLRPDVWTDFQNRFRIPQILEFYAATEGNVSLFNVEGKVGAIGRVPPFLAHRFPAALVRFDVEAEAPARDANGRCIRCEPHEVGEAIGPLFRDATNVGSRFEGYTDSGATEKKILHDVFEPGDAWFRTGDLMRRDEKGFFYFVDRIGDTFRWKGENVATSEVSNAICEFHGIKEANVYSVAIPGTDGRAGMAAIVVDGELDLQGLRDHLDARLPEYAWPMFLRIQQAMSVTGTFKYAKNDLVSDGYDPDVTADPLYFNAREQGAYVRLDKMLYDQIQSGAMRV